MSCADVREDGAIRVPRVKGSEVPGDPPPRDLIGWRDDEDALFSMRYYEFLWGLPKAEYARKRAAVTAAAAVAAVRVRNGGGR